MFMRDLGGELKIGGKSQLPGKGRAGATKKSGEEPGEELAIRFSKFASFLALAKDQ